MAAVIHLALEAVLREAEPMPLGLGGLRPPPSHSFELGASHQLTSSLRHPWCAARGFPLARILVNCL